MRTDFITILLFLSVITQSTLSKSPHEGQNRRILHQPLFPATSDPPPPPPPRPPSGPDTLNPDQPFLHVPATPGQAQQPPPGGTTPLANSAATRAPNLARKVAIALSSGVLALALLSALAFYLYRRRSENQDESQKPFGPHSLTDSQESRVPPSAFLFMETVEPSAPTVARERNAGHGSPYRKLNPGKRSERYRPSPELQPLPPLPKPAAATSSPPPMSSTSSDDETHDNNFHTPQGSIMSNESPGSRYTYANNPISQISQMNRTRPENHSRPPYSKRTSTKSRLSAPSPDTKPVIIPSIKQPPPSVGPFMQSKMLTYTPKGPKFVGPPPPLDMASLQSITIEGKPAIKIPIPPPPPAVVAAQPSVPRKFRYVERNTPSPVSKNVTRQDSSSPSSKASSGTGNTVIPGHGDTNKAINSSEKNDKDDRDGPRPKLKPLHWDKVLATSERATVWDQLKSSSFQLNEDAMESLFGCNSITSVPNEAANRRQSALPDFEQENRVLDPKKSQNIAILIRALNVTREEVSEALLDGNPEGLGPELLETLSKMAPTKEEEIKLKDYNGEVSKLGSAERFLKGILDIPFAFKRVEAMLYRANFDAEVLYLKKSFQTLEEASEELKNSRLFLKLLEAVLRTGNRMNDGTNRGDARAFKLDTLLKLADVKGADGKTTLLHFVVQEIIRSEGPNLDLNKTEYEFKEEEFRKQGLQLVVRLGKELGSVKKAAGMDSGVLSGYVMKLEAGLDKVRSMMQREKQGLLLQGKFFSSMKEFLEEADGEISRIKAEEGKALSQVKEVTEYFHGDAAKEEAHPLRIFLVVRDFLGILDKVCKDVGRKPAMATVGAGRSFRILENAYRPRFNADFDDG